MGISRIEIEIGKNALFCMQGSRRLGSIKTEVWHLSQLRVSSLQIFKLAHVLLSCGTFLDISISMREMPIWD
jgi:hypothetical protein